MLDIYPTLGYSLSQEVNEMTNQTNNPRAVAASILGSAKSDAKTSAARANGRKGGRPRSDYATKFHRDGTVTVWDVYEQTWVRTHVSRVSDQVLASLSSDERARILGHRERAQASDSD